MKTTRSHEKVNYLLRLKKQIERKIIIETLQKLNPILPKGSIEKYRYFGFGSVYFADFILFHKYLNINKMNSIEIEEEDEIRCIFNKPYKFIDFEISDCNSYMQTKLKWDDKLLVWLDYDDPLSMEMINDVEYLASRINKFDFFIMTVEEESPIEPKDFIKEFTEYIPSKYKVSNNILKQNFLSALNNIIITAIKNGFTHNKNKFDLLQLFNFTYKDTKKMYTFGCVFGDETFFSRVKSKLSNSKYLSYDEKIIDINCPILTPKEKIQLDYFIKMDSNIDCRLKTIKDVGLSSEEIKKYSTFYKHYPQFFESIY